MTFEQENVLTDEVLDIIETIFFSPLVVEDHFDSDTFDVERKIRFPIWSQKLKSLIIMHMGN